MSYEYIVMDLSEQNIKCLKLFNDCGLKYMIVGGYAVNFHGYRRPTKDLDIYVDNDHESSEILSKVVTQLIGPHPKIHTETFENRKRQLNLASYNIDLEFLTAIGSMDFREAFRRSLVTNINGLELRIISKEDLIESKRIAARPIDMQDIYNLSELCSSCTKINS